MNYERGNGMYQSNNYNSDGGSTVVEKNIILSVVSLATKEIAGVCDLVDNFALSVKGLLSSNYSNGVQLSMVNDKICIDVYISVFYGYNVSDIAYKVQENVKNSISSMVDIEIDKVNIHVMSVVFEKEEVIE